MSNYQCEICNNTIENENEAIHDDAGQYHEDCHDEHQIQESAYWLAWYKGEKAKSVLVDDGQGYDWGDPKNSQYLEHILDNA